MDKLSVCCLGYNHAKFLKQCIDSVVSIGYNNIEVIVVDDGSDDDSVWLLEQLKSTYAVPLLIVAQNNTANIGANFNRALSFASGEYITFISLDDVFNPQAMFRSIEALNMNSNLAFVASSNVSSINESGVIVNEVEDLPSKRVANPSVQELLEMEYEYFGSFYLQGTIFRKELVSIVGGFDEDMTGDDLILRTKILRYLQGNTKWTIKIVTENTVFYRIHGDNLHKNNERQLKIVSEYLDKYWQDRGNPDLLAKWLIGYLNRTDVPVEKKMASFSINARVAALLDNYTVRQKLRDMLRLDSDADSDADDGPMKYIFKKEKLGLSMRRITLLGFIRFTYRREHATNTRIISDKL